MHVLYEDAGKLKAEKIFSQADASLQVESGSGKRSKIKRTAVLFEFEQPAPEALLPAAEAAATEFDTDFLWECAPAEEFSAAELAEAYFGHPPTAVEKTAVLLALRAAPAHFHRRGHGRFRAAPPDILKAALAAIEKKRLQAEQQQAWTDALVAGTLPEPIAAVAAGFLDHPDKNTLEWKAFDAALRELNVRPEVLLLKLGVWAHPLAMMRARFFARHFPQGTAWPEVTVQEWGEALPKADVEAYSVDDASTTEIDDALSAEVLDADRVRVGVHIAVPALAVQRGNAFDDMARSRMATVYMPGEKIPMLPRALIGAFTLNAGQWRPALSLYATVRLSDGEVLASDTRLERIRVAENLRLDQLEDRITEVALDAGDDALPHAAWVHPLWQATRALRQARDRVRGRPEINDRVDYLFELSGPADDPDTEVHLIARQRNAPLEQIVAECMILANSQWGALLAQHGVPGIYRSQAAGRTRMSTQALPHESIAVMQYAWSTSPLRRYVDLVNQGQILAAAEHGVSARLVAPFKPRDADLYAIVSAFEAQYACWNKFQNDVERYWSIRWLQQQAIREVRARVLHDNLVRLTCAPLVVRVAGLPTFERGQDVILEITGFDLLDLDVSCRLREAA